jgi:cytoskeletal protein RodZ
MRIALGVVLVFAALWFVALRPKPVEEVVSDPAPATEASTPQTAATPAETPAATPAEPTSDATQATTPAKKDTATTTSGGKGARAVLADLDAGRTVVLLVWDGKSADDRSVRRAVTRVDRHGGKVRTHVATLSKLSSYEAITKGVPITESPTVLVIDTERQARVISGLTVKAEIDDAVDRALKAK